MEPTPVALALELPPDEAWALAQLVKRAGYSDFRALAADDAEAWAMQAAAERLRRALAEAGCAPR
ncbi:hypothetical protein [Ralstonia pseudosolanacearum]|uniref:DUF7706 family protein n=1 Tax=Ralstonia pseudosolanacearum TaxID=1310165 RepID=UPI001FFB2E17|nr:hypothetical protein [Ralstonia pseudosolanacearum]